MEQSTREPVVLWFGKRKPNEKEIDALPSRNITWLKTLSESKVTCYEESRLLLLKIEIEAVRLGAHIVCGEFPSYLLQQLFHARNDKGKLSFGMAWDYMNGKTIFVEVGRI